MLNAPQPSSGEQSNLRCRYVKHTGLSARPLRICDWEMLLAIRYSSCRLLAALRRHPPLNARHLSVS